MRSLSASSPLSRRLGRRELECCQALDDEECGYLQVGLNQQSLPSRSCIRIMICSQESLWPQPINLHGVAHRIIYGSLRGLERKTSRKMA